ncbi:hypothetical protein EJB05_49274, partial [Eragrostis curvula]
MEINPAAATNASHGVLPLDVVFDILMRLPAKEICRFRAVCRHWRSLTSDPLFIEAHAARHPGPLIVASFDGDGEHVHLMDLSGHVVKRLPVADARKCLCSRLDLICVADMKWRHSVINPATGAVLHLPDAPPQGSCLDHSSSDEEVDWGDSVWQQDPEYSVFALGRVESTGEYKVLRIPCVDKTSRDIDDTSWLVCSVLTIVDGSCVTRWRSTKSPDLPIDMDSGVVVGGSVYYFLSDEYETELQKDISEGHDIVEPHFIASFDLETEKWTTIPGPCPVDGDYGSSDDGEDVEYNDMWSESTMTELNGYLVLVHERDTENHVWAKKYSIQAPRSVITTTNIGWVKPLLLLDDGRIAIFLRDMGVLLLYDPTADVFSKVHTRRLGAVGLYTGSLLNSQNIAKQQSIAEAGDLIS